MKKIFRLFALLIAIVLSFSLVACGPRELTEEEKALLAERREIVVEYMRKQTDFLWRAGESFSYTILNKNPAEDNSSSKCNIVEGQLYRGMPYTYAGGTFSAFMEYTESVGDDGIPVISGLNWEAMTGSASGDYARVGNDCSSAVFLSYQQIGDSLKANNTKTMTVNNGWLRVGEYQSDPSSISDNGTHTTQVCYDNGQEVMFEAYAQLQRGDAMITRSTTKGHTIMITEINVVRDKEGKVDPYQSSIVFLEQTSGNFKTNRRYFDEELGEYVNVFTGVDETMSFQMIFNDKYLPITCKELIDPKTPAKATVSDSVKTPDINNLFEGKITCNYYIDSIYITITDSNGAVVQKCAGRNVRYIEAPIWEYDLSRFVNDNPNGFLGKIDVNALSAGSYNCKMEVRIANNNQMFTVRDFSFNV